MTFIESPIFARYVGDYLSEESYADLQWHLLSHPDAGDMIRGSGGIRKLRWKALGKGKRGGVRVIYYWHTSQGEIWLLTLYAKNEAEKIPSDMLVKIREQFD
ncbi:MAG: transcriptional regulator [Rickettsiales bacterium]|nr:transcriptional regulator [Rickettsiales bacterium]